MKQKHRILRFACVDLIYLNQVSEAKLNVNSKVVRFQNWKRKLYVLIKHYTYLLTSFNPLNGSAREVQS